MNNNWWQELLRFFLQKLDINRIVHMLIIFIILVIFVPASIKEVVNAHNPEIFGNYWMYYLLLACISFVVSALTRGIESFLAKLFCAFAGDAKIRFLSPAEKSCLIELLRQPGATAHRSDHNSVVEGLVVKGILIKTTPISTVYPYSTYSISDKHYAKIVKHLEHYL
ncbi:super-infection exclusion protein B [Citrobacter koseri]|uniref:Superinfection exclusion B family protein n=1 Tax=Citrobacter koseri TaxID=545 RepID=A0AAW4ELX3_CITKO|nr:super-infection exclusion protein B [Citrobacter koseri]MBJ8714991.1 superinfection exclusion B family protein [Citrobacter koseri]MBJ8752548.1 superinfection exclusion B family protein [Citrobacter koseri]MBJ8775761.1 superinfection exclusion B family protein [Citrobacter koseri]MBJ8859798.1 superinfection exclusion B family protein [Citrobacter koseri]MBJ8864349.1 superinfection exclusion B family protein [Citrobacter koseri]